MVEVVVCADTLEDERWSKDTARKTIRSDEWYLLSVGRPLFSIRL
jgi:hypothetical protein